MNEFFAYIIKNLVDQPDQVQVNAFHDDKGIIVEVRVKKEDIGKVLGRKGSTIKALRTLAMMICARAGHRVQLVLVE